MGHGGAQGAAVGLGGTCGKLDMAQMIPWVP